ncbi:hypothetical protein PRIPAC_73666 [Pristionchus pacificus]|uniref:Uncharacterized protein n=1 Tax=Pristionchus pacificus TaxID=54126 RepID=A0A2A6C0T2_PRIPA|nr:hypothetical protein PRIPAC_73666 [Pristionchus pacificus]|eukprot:PDM71641.1 hypothetical protein PRIPAC_38048 [Pristionchus pacificus]
MQRVRSSQMIVLVLTLATAAALEEKISTVAKKCCPAAAFQCCYDAIDFHTRLSCSEIPEEKRVEAMRCVQTELYGEKDMKWTGIDHLDCCEAFKNDYTDTYGMCYATCKYAMMAPSMKSRAKLHLIEHCRMTNPLNTCFNQCRIDHNEKAAKGLPIPAYKDVETDRCARYKMKDDELYPINQIMKA